MYLAFANPSEFKAGANRSPPFNPFGPNMMAFTSPEDLMKNLPKAMGNIGKAMGGGGFPGPRRAIQVQLQVNMEVGRPRKRIVQGINLM